MAWIQISFLLKVNIFYKCSFILSKGDEDQNGLGDICTSNKDFDHDGVDDNIDNCLMFHNPQQLDDDADGVGNECDDDIDNDGIPNVDDNCKLIFNPQQDDTDANGKGDACEIDEDGDGSVMRSYLYSLS